MLEQATKLDGLSMGLASGLSAQPVTAQEPSNKERKMTEIEELQATIADLNAEVEKQKDLAINWEKEYQKLYDIIDNAIYDLKKGL